MCGGGGVLFSFHFIFSACYWWRISLGFCLVPEKVVEERRKGNVFVVVSNGYVGVGCEGFSFLHLLGGRTAWCFVWLLRKLRRGNRIESGSVVLWVFFSGMEGREEGRNERISCLVYCFFFVLCFYFRFLGSLFSLLVPEKVVGKK